MFAFLKGKNRQTLVFVIWKPGAVFFFDEKILVKFREFISVVSIFISVALFLSRSKATTSPHHE